MLEILKRPFCDCALWSLWKVFFFSEGTAPLFWHPIPALHVIISYFNFNSFFSTGLRVSSELRPFKTPKYSSVCFYVLVSDEQRCVRASVCCVCVCRGVPVGGIQAWHHCQILLRLAAWVRVWSRAASAEGWGGSVADMKVMGESCLPLHCQGESRQGARSLWDSLWASAVFDLVPPLCYTLYSSIAHTHLPPILKHRLA